MDQQLFAWSRADCDTIMADYVLMLTGRDPMAKWRNLYGCAAEAQDLIRRGDGNCNLVTEGMASIGLYPIDVETIRRGDLAIIRFGEAEVTGLYLDPRTACKSLRGRVMLRSIPIRAWRCV